jgi:hypothetical protein
MKNTQRQLLSAGLIGAMLSLVSVPALAGGAMIMKTGKVRLWDDSQYLDGLQRDFDTSSWRTFSLAWEHRGRHGMGMGIEYITYRHGYTPAVSGDGQAKTQILLFSARKYFDASSIVHPFVGLGMGLGHTSVTGGASIGPDVNFEVQADTGIEFRFDNVGFYMELKGLYNDSSGPSGNNYDPSATGVFGGMSFIF